MSRQLESGTTAMVRLEDVMPCLLDTAIYLLDGNAGSILLLDESRQYLRLKFSKGYRTSEFTFAVGEGVAGWVAQKGEAVTVPLTNLEPRFLPRISPLKSGQDIASVICAPIFVEQEIKGVVCIDSVDRHYKEADIPVLMPIARQLGKALAKEQEIPDLLFGEQMELASGQTNMTNVIQELSLSNRREDLAPVFLEAVRGLFKQCDSGFFVMEEEEGRGNYQIIAKFGQIPDIIQDLCKKFPHCKNLEPKQAILYTNGFHTLEEDCLFKGYQAKSIMYIPLISDGQIRGILVVGSTFPNAFNEKDLKSMQIFASQISLLYRAGISYSDLQYYANYIVNSVAVGVLCIDLGGRVTLVNKMAQDILGLEAEQLVGRNYLEFSPYMEMERFEEATRQLISTGEKVDDIRVGLTYPGQEKKTLEVNLNLLRNTSGIAIGMIVSFEDISGKLILEEQLRRAERMLMAGQLAAGAAHEIKNPLTTIKGFAQLLKNSLPEEDRRAGYLDTVLNEVEQINRILNEMDSLAKVSLKKLDWVDIPKLLEEVLEEKQKSGRLDAILVKRSYEGAITPLFGDRESLKKAMLNLISNSIEAMDGKGDLRLEVSSAMGGEIVVVITDTGVGFSEEEKEKIFNPFYTKRPDATGLGLSISYKTIRDHGGTMFIESQIGRGTRVTLKLPINFSFGDILRQ